MEQPRVGDHICYYSDLRKMRSHYPHWDITQSLPDTLEQIVAGWRKREARAGEQMLADVGQG